MTKQDKQIIIGDFKKVIKELNIEGEHFFICNILDNIKANTISIKYFKESEEKAKEFTLKSSIPESWNGNFSWWTWLISDDLYQKDIKVIKQKLVKLKIAFLESLIKELEEE